MKYTQHIVFLTTFCLFVLLGCSQDKVQDGWQQVESGTDAHLYGIHFQGSKLGWAVGSDGIVISSTNGGKTWTGSDSKSITDDILTQVNFTTPTNGWLVGRGKVHYTGSGGKSWRVQYQDRPIGESPRGILDLHFITTSEGWAVGGSGTILHTKDGGAKWQPVKTHSEKHLWGVHFVDPKHGWIVGEEGEVLHTQDGGNRWVSQDSGAEQPLFAVHFVDEQNGWIAGTNGLILHTKDGGKNWKRQKTSFKQSLRDIKFKDKKEGWAVGEEGLILWTVDGGNEWNRNPSPTTHNLQDIFLLKSSGWIAGEKGTILMLK